MARTLIRDLLFATTVFLIFIVGGVSLLSILGDSNSGYVDDPLYDDFNKSFDQSSEFYSSVDDLESGITNADTDFGVFGVLNSLISSSWQGLTLTLSSFGFMNSIFLGANYLFGIPVWVITLISSLITIVIIFAIWSAIFQRDL